MEVYTGVDLIETERIKEAIKNEDFLKRIYTENEIAYCEAKKGEARIQGYAARFAGKEAIFKAISKVMELDMGINWKKIEILKEESGRPYVNLKIEKIQKERLKIDVSLAHIKEYAIATAVATYKE